MHPPSADGGECTQCGEEIRSGEDFCRECGHSVIYAGASDGADDESDLNSGGICPNCGAAHLVIVSLGHPQCESCGYTERY